MDIIEIIDKYGLLLQLQDRQWDGLSISFTLLLQHEIKVKLSEANTVLIGLIDRIRMVRQ